MSQWAIVYDLDVEGLKESGYSKGEAVNFCNAVRACFTESNFSKSQQLTLYMSDQANAVPDAFQVCRSLARVPDAIKFLKRLMLMRVDELHDLLPQVVHGKVSAAVSDPVWTEIERVFPGDD